MSSSSTIQALASLPPEQRAAYPTPGTADGSFDSAMRAAADSNQGIISFDNFANFSTARGRSTTAVVNGAAPGLTASGEPSGTAMLGGDEATPVAAALMPMAAVAAETPIVTNRDRFGDLYSSSNLGVIWDAEGDERRTPGGGNPDEIINLIYELKALGVDNAERFWDGDANGGEDHLGGFILLNQLKLSVMRSGQQLLGPAEYRAIGADMFTRGIQPNKYPDGFLYGS